jgi:hypothetical protein
MSIHRSSLTSLIASDSSWTPPSSRNDEKRRQQYDHDDEDYQIYPGTNEGLDMKLIISGGRYKENRRDTVERAPYDSDNDDETLNEEGVGYKIAFWMKQNSLDLRHENDVGKNDGWSNDSSNDNDYQRNDDNIRDNTHIQTDFYDEIDYITDNDGRISIICNRVSYLPEDEEEIEAQKAMFEGLSKVHMYVYIYIYIYTYIHMHLHLYIYIYTFKYVYIYTYLYMYCRPNTDIWRVRKNYSQI